MKGILLASEADLKHYSTSAIYRKRLIIIYYKSMIYFLLFIFMFTDFRKLLIILNVTNL